MLHGELKIMGHHWQQAWIVSQVGNLAHSTCPASPDSLCHCSAGTVAGQKHLSGGQVHLSRTSGQCLMSSPDNNNNNYNNDNDNNNNNNNNNQLTYSW